MLVAAGQFAVTSVWEKNAEICASLMAQAAENDVSLFVLPEALLARDDHDADLSVKSAQLLEGEFLGRLRRESKRNMMTTILTIHVPSTPGRACWWHFRQETSSPVMPNCISMMHLPFRNHAVLMLVMKSLRYWRWKG